MDLGTALQLGIALGIVGGVILGFFAVGLS